MRSLPSLLTAGGGGGGGAFGFYFCGFSTVSHHTKRGLSVGYSLCSPRDSGFGGRYAGV